MQRQLTHKQDPEANQLNLVDKYNTLHEKGFEKFKMSHYTLRNIYGIVLNKFICGSLFHWSYYRSYYSTDDRG